MFNRGSSDLGSYHLRNRVAAALTHYNINRQVLLELWAEQEHPADWYASAMAPHRHGTIQGELQQTAHGLELLWTHALKPMREALAEQQYYARGLLAWCKLRAYLCPNSYDWLLQLLDWYPGHVIEFSCFDRYWGTVPRHNTVFWEVRRY